MMATLTDIREDLALRLAEIHGLNVYATIPDSIEEPACVIGMPDPAVFNLTYGPTGVTYTIPVRLYVARVDSMEAQALIDPYIAPTGTASIKQAVEATTVDACWQVVVVTQVADFGAYQIGGLDYLGCEFQTEVIAL